MTTTLEEILALEQEMHLTSTRRNRERMEQLLHPDFYEIGRSGVRYSRQEIMAEFENDCKSHNGRLIIYRINTTKLQF